jgi:DNA helicase II / ATP-dependent DNA helicase PcrA
MPLPNQRIVIASAGSRKTTSIIEEALACKGDRILLTTYTNENLEQLRCGILKRAGMLPSNIKLMSWFSLLLQEAVRPYQNLFVDSERIGTIQYVQPNMFVPESDHRRHYLTTAGDIYGERLAKFAVRCDRETNGLVVGRLERCFDRVFLDELQDLSSDHLDFLEKLFRSRLLVTAVGDPRQATFMTSRSAKNRQYRRSHIIEWVRKLESENVIKIEERTGCYRSNQTICDFADGLYPTFSKSSSKNTEVTGHDGLFVLSPDAAIKYFELFKPVVLRSSKVIDTLGLPAKNIGVMKGSTFEHVLIFPTGPMRSYLQSGDLGRAGDLSKLYIAVTRAKYSAAFVVEPSGAGRRVHIDQGFAPLFKFWQPDSATQ